ncbi:PTS sugar transporter subunit IIA [Bacillus sp. V3-13]|uniref:PTS sugar transporter subunit IIA n=1 Tax=Bacillus sp. V3-13 TaxID=2053728 RepID=UPI000C774FC1|nr:PTS sugar transporter subunit IIA [Bacillus sp. V3-13]PLR75955.1 PTS sugar transporter subunit IIA [Bacillus sp. V3-13]
MKFLEENLVSVAVEAPTPEDAIKAAGQLLVEGGAVTSSYVEAMLQSFQKNGPYFVLAPQIALPHARPEDGVKEASVSFVQLRHPIEFGSSNDPVQLVFALGASSSEEHLLILKKLMTLLNDPANVEKLKEATNYNDIKTIIGRE